MVATPLHGTLQRAECDKQATHEYCDQRAPTRTALARAVSAGHVFKHERDEELRRAVPIDLCASGNGLEQECVYRNIACSQGSTSLGIMRAR